MKDVYWHVVSTRHDRFSRSVKIAVEHACGAKMYFVKLPGKQKELAPWSPKLEYESFQILWDASLRSEGIAVPEPVSFGREPPHLTTTFVAGESALTILKRGCSRLPSSRSRRAAADVSRRLARWLSEKLRLTTREAPPFTLEHYRELCGARIAEIERFYGTTGRRIADLAQDWFERSLPDSPLGECFPLGTQHAQQDDCTAQNYILQPDGALCGLDFEVFRWESLWVDPCVFRCSLEHMAT